MESSLPGVQPQQMGTSFVRSADGKLRFNQGNQSIISDPSAGKTILLDHATKEAQIFPLQPNLQKPGVPTIGAPSFTPPQAPINVQDLGKRMMNGHEVEGKLYTFAPPQMPAAPNAPGMPSISAPQPQQLEVWNSPKFQLPLASRLTGDMGKQTTIAKQVTPCQPPASAFQIPHDYKVVPPPHAPTASS